ncbi:MAG: 3-hydroxyisobutyrate dehydrogenase [Candidatus Dactylopiibacterium carminicum]|uniref:3-hydroxyisobutyrate dehydrogenase n=1 Tax=Candidatus Dactylopiibacterium carminicum TaxID=857335 RepID=A0A272ENQ6_9RHOO|nr:NAD(P)-dependent oxidoreductase [Candidatus Dactylopiibacterium carminicum]KAF7598118.1 NAD(P)-dependent oxidoreductase [Candidatus Dactylopiibacterium carminicum]PAS91741.1 MAG: 3-hydroxyisobutyrate dehydrogenase [Candidatus Dactylopiibacterium carminicum]PAS94014.1 MAG: 3-hydroxyisobutyrate dehydrogenase [Candidatus Dactylopiibacterium carminicum]PAS96678.1 MAG: 3-hydroxyisobutyrate dehydrogenase [Candidatus Dactylopiibacterium carminicum]
MAKYGFLGLGIMGSAMAANLVRAGFEVTVWNRTASRCAPLVALGARQAATPREVAESCDITFAMLADPAAALEACSGPDGVAAGIGSGRGYIDMSTVDDATAQTISTLITERGGRFLEAPVSGTKKPAEDGTLILLTAGDQSLYDEAGPAFDKLGKKRLFLGPVGQGARMKLVVNLVMGSMLAALGEGLSLGLKGGLDGTQILEVLDAGAMACPMFRGKGPMLLAGEEYPASFPLKHMQKDLRLALELGESLGQNLATTAASNELFKRVRIDGHGDEDIGAVYRAIR